MPAIAAPVKAPTDRVSIDLEGVQLSGLNGLALQDKDFPTKLEVMKVIPKHCFVKDTLRSFKYAVISCAITLSMGGLAAALIPMKVREQKAQTKVRADRWQRYLDAAAVLAWLWKHRVPST